MVSHDHDHLHVIGAFQEASPEERFQRFSASAVLRFGSAAIQMWGGLSGGESALVVESAEELSDAAAFGAAAIEARTQKRGLVQKARHAMIGFAVGAAAIATVETGVEIASEGHEWREALGGIDLANNGHKAAIAALAINSAVFWLNRKGRQSKKPSDKFGFRDSVRDFVIPGAVVGLSAARAPHLAEFALEGGGAAYGWYNAVQLWRGWRSSKAKA